jgi:hypothetical protein
MSVLLLSNKPTMKSNWTAHEILERIKARTLMTPEQQAEQDAQSAERAAEYEVHKFYMEITGDEHANACQSARQVEMTGLPDSMSYNSRSHILRSIEDVFMLEPVETWFQSHAKNPNQCLGRIRSAGSEDEYLWIEVRIAGTTDAVNFKMTWSDHFLPEDPRRTRMRAEREHEARETDMDKAQLEADWQYDEGDRV